MGKPDRHAPSPGRRRYVPRSTTLRPDAPPSGVISPCTASCPAPPVEIDPDDAYRAERPPHPHRPWVMMNMIASLDGAIEVDGTSGALGSAGDKAVFSTLRSIPDVILVGSATVQAERYGPPSTSVSTRARRLAHGATPVATLAVVTASLSLDLDLPMFAGSGPRPTIVTVETAPADRVDAAAEVADVVVAGIEQVDFGQALAALADRGARVVLSEGGPTINGQLLAADLVDEICLSVAPMAAAGPSRRIAFGSAPLPEAIELDLDQVLVEDHYLFLRYLTARSSE